MRLGKFGRTRLQIFHKGLFRHADSRGTWSRSFDQEIFEQIGQTVAQASVSVTKKAQTLRGLHSMRIEAQEWKLVTCCNGAIWDVAVDARPDSPSFGKWQGAQLDCESGDFALIPPGWAHGFISLSDNAVVSYSMSSAYTSGLEVGYHWESPSFAIDWPMDPLLISDKDQNLPRV